VRRLVRPCLGDLDVEEVADLVKRPLGDRRHQPVAIDEVAIQDRLADAARCRHLLHRHVGALAPDHVDGRVEQFAAAQATAFGQRGPWCLDVRPGHGWHCIIVSAVGGDVITLAG
jgi:hypothetical protein